MKRGGSWGMWGQNKLANRLLSGILLLCASVSTMATEMETYYATVVEKFTATEKNVPIYYVTLEIQGNLANVAIAEPFYQNVKLQDVFVLPSNVPVQQLTTYLEQNEIEVQRPLVR